jgi:hypothetical protein
MSNLRVDNITDELGTGAPNFPNGITVDGTIGGTIIASQAEALAGTNNTKLMTPLRAAQARIDPENRIINGAFDFWQRGTSGTAVGYAAADRWRNDYFGGTVTQSRQSFTLGDTFGTNNPVFFLRQTVSGQTLASQNAVTVQAIEGVRSYAGQTITVLGWARRSSGTGNMVVELYQSFGTGGSPSALVFIPGQTVTLTSSWAAFALTFSVPSITGKTLGTDNNDYLAIVFWTSAGSDYNDRTNSLGLQTIGVDLWGIHTKLGTHTTAAVDLYKQPELGPELARCQRYYQTSYPIGVAVQAYTNVTDGASFICINTSDTSNGGPLPVSMRATPEFAVYSSNGGVGANSARDGGGGNITGITLVGGTTNNLPRLSKTAGLGTQGAPYTAHWTADAEL